MPVYLLILVLFFALFILTKLSNIKNADVILGGMMMLILALIAGFRSDVGMDYQAYKELFSEINTEVGAESSVEPGFVLINRIIYGLGGNYQMLFMIIAVISYALFYKFISYFSTNIFFSLLVFICIGQLYLNSFNAVRQFLAMSVFAYATLFIAEKKFWKYAECIILAALFGHASAILLIPLYFANREISIKSKLILLTLIVFASKYLIVLIENSKYAVYLKLEVFTKETSMVTFLYLLLSLFILFRQKYILNNNRYKNILVNMNYCYLILCVLLIVFSNTPLIELINRYSYYFILFYSILIPALLTEISNRSNRLIYQSIVVTLLVFLFVRSSIILGQEYNLTPFKFNFFLFE
ncbi:EpsG family protein [Parabacteroides sp. AM08-6]|uniref:EpsG family protein n=1 Tax=Parabacteroides sp. AM08-6 TaxID=2292053 RepID=UPI000EFF1226|nr:EpsG family protein [Parabacteroides sp. AM08-6]RHJ85293.1 EpsG family protein [Parabacteroides sp. AM08-6]